MARNVVDLQTLFAVMAHSDVKTFPASQLKDLRVVFYTDDGVAPVTEETRRAVEAAAGALRAAATSEKAPASASATDRPPSPPMIELGKTKIKMSRLGQGTGVHGGDRQSDQTRMGFAKLVDLMHHAYDRGIRFFDLADLYGTHVYFREALREMKRDDLTILTKMWWR